MAPAWGLGSGNIGLRWSGRLGPWAATGNGGTIPNIVKQLKLTDDQRKAMDGIMQDHRMKLIDLHANLEKAEVTMGPLMKADTPNETAIVAQIDKVVQARAELEKANARFLLDIRMQLSRISGSSCRLCARTACSVAGCMAGCMHGGDATDTMDTMDSGRVWVDRAASSAGAADNSSGGKGRHRKAARHHKEGRLPREHRLRRPDRSLREQASSSNGAEPDCGAREGLIRAAASWFGFECCTGQFS